MKLAHVVLDIHKRRDEEIRPDLLKVVRDSFLGLAREASEATLGSANTTFIKKLEATIEQGRLVYGEVGP